MIKMHNFLPLFVEAAKLRRRRSHAEMGAAAFGSFVNGWARSGDFAQSIAHAESRHQREVRRSELWVGRIAAATYGSAP